jgi:hypothetical protein
VNRQWTLILALGICLASTVAASSAFADPIYAAPGDESGADGSGSNGIGDPDVPDGAGRAKFIKNGAQSRGGMSGYNVRVVGDDRVDGRAWMMRLYVVWRGTRSIWFRF